VPPPQEYIVLRIPRSGLAVESSAVLNTLPRSTLTQIQGCMGGCDQLDMA
jgi:hypothetical protein